MTSKSRVFSAFSLINPLAVRNVALNISGITPARNKFHACLYQDAYLHIFSRLQPKQSLRFGSIVIAYSCLLLTHDLKRFVLTFPDLVVVAH